MDIAAAGRMMGAIAKPIHGGGGVGSDAKTLATTLDAAVARSDAGKGPAQLISNGMPSNPLWAKEARVYQVYVRSFADSNGDGIGDLKGVTQNLDHIQDLGIDTIHLNPFFKSPMRDGGYDISDFRDVDPSLGTLDDAKELIDQAHARGIRVITENVANHTSDQHPWFQDELAQLAKVNAEGGTAALEALDPNSLKYVWNFTSKADGPPKLFEETRVIFQDFEPSNWTWNDDANGWYWHRFFHHQPDLNWDNPQVVKEMQANSDFWFDLGVDGQRLDAIPYLFERTGTFPDGTPFQGENLTETHDVLKQMRAHIDGKYDSRVLLGEANMPSKETLEYFGDGDELHALYNFPEMPRKYLSLWTGDKQHIIDGIEMSRDIPENAAWLTFNRNHDEMTLEKVPTETREWAWDMFRKGNADLGIKPSPETPINLGLRARQWELVGGDETRYRQLNSLLYTLPGTPILYNGDEIAMRTVPGLYDRDGVRTAMQWSDEVNGGFSSADPEQLFLPSAVNDARVATEGINVAAQRADADSTLNHTKKLIHMRGASPALQRGEVDVLTTSSDNVLAFTRTADDDQVLQVANLSWNPASSKLDLGELAGRRVEIMDASNASRTIDVAPSSIDLEPNEFLTLRVLRD